ncbi:ribokinase [Dokdonella soli]|uniref:Ribokinase n=1 Tax=Dokdonella soli TaxID=529810 RepID=A0ABN1IEZ3_9GAMM
MSSPVSRPSSHVSPIVIVVGSYVQDHAWLTDRFPQTGETRRALGFNTGPGGKGFNQAVACARQDVATLFVGAIGNDHLGAIAQRFADEEELPCRWQVRDDVPTAASSIVIDRSGSNLIVVNLAANEHLDPAFVEAQADAFEGAAVLLLQLENNLDAIAAALALGARHALLRVLNPAPVHPALDAMLLAQCDLITPNETEFALLLERIAGEHIDAATLAARADTDLHLLARKLGVETVVITLGAHGCFVSHGEHERRGDTQAFYRLAPERVKTVDSTGAGDAFSGTLVAALVRFAGRPFREAVVHANRAAAMSTEIVGTAPAMPRFEAVSARFGT